VEVVSLAAAAMPLRHRAVRDGLLLVCRHRRVLERFVTQTVLQYLDFKPLRHAALRIMRNAILDEASW
jgi:hypothetical protein